MAHKHSVYDTDAHLTIVPTSRKIIGAERIKLVRGDHNSSRVTFDIPRFVDGHDMAETSIVEIHYINISADGKNTNEDVYPADDVQISPESDDVVIFSWLISNNATKYAGTLSFMLCFKCVTGEVLDYSWRTDTAKGVHVLKSLDCTPSAVADITDILTAWEMKIADLMGRVESMEDAIDGKLDKVTDPHWTQRLYGVEVDGTQKTHLLRWQPDPYSVAQRGDGGVLHIGTPSGNNDALAVNVGFANEHYVAKVESTYMHTRLYGVNAEGNKQNMIPYHWTAQQETLALRTTGGALAVGTPIEDSHAIPLGFGDGRYVAKVSNPYWSPRLYAIEPDGTQKEVEYSTAPNPYSIAWRGNHGALRVGEPIEKDHASTRKYVDDKGWQSGYVAGANEYIATISTDFSGFVDVPTATAQNVYIPMLGRDSIELLVTVKDADGELHSEYVEIYDLGEGQLNGYSMGRFGLASTEDASGDLYINVLASK